MSADWEHAIPTAPGPAPLVRTLFCVSVRDIWCSPRSRTVLRAGLLLLAVAFLNDALGLSLSSQTRVSGALLLLAFGWLAAPWHRLARDPMAWLGLVIALGTGAVWYHGAPAGRALGLPLFISGLALTTREDQAKARELAPAAVGLCLYAVFRYLEVQLPLQWYLDGFATGLCRVVDTFREPSPLLGAQALGVPVVLLFLCCNLGVAAVSESPCVLEIFLSSLWMLAVLMANLWLENSLFVFAGCLLGTALLYRRGPTRRLPLSVHRPKAILLSLAAGGLSFLCVVTCGFWPRSSFRARKVLVCGKHRYSLALPTYGRYGRSALPRGATFGILTERFLPAHGYEVVVRDDEVTARDLHDTGCVLVINPTQRLGDDGKRAIWDYVGRGGSLLVLGDHTDIGGIMRPLNHLLEPAGIEFKFDSAVPLDNGWNWYDGIRRLPHPVNARVLDEDDLEISVGASLNCPGSATPLLVGTNAFSDTGRPFYGQSRLGNMKHDVGEQMSGLLLSATKRFGKGKVLVFGDTSSFQNGALVSSADFVARVFAFMCSNEHRRLWHRNTTLALVCAAGLVVLLARADWHLSAVMLTCFAAIAASHIAATTRATALPVTRPTSGVACIDWSHGERFRTDLGSDDSSAALCVSLQRSGYLPLLLRRLDPDMLQACELLFLLAPSRRFTQSEVDGIVAFVERGGRLVIATGRDEAWAVHSLLSRLGVTVGEIPLGPAHTAVPLTVDLVEDAPETIQKPGEEAAQKPSRKRRHKLRFLGAWPVSSSDPNARGLVKAWEHYLVVLLDRKAGSVCVIGDPRFLLSRNLENFKPSKGHYNLANILLLREIIRKSGGEKTGV